ncbi:MAG: hypothetical protein FWG45_04575, partial [Oscillospiraceae bacterium]|nr:hypothetical protein [Oscillospiraceae bacterium]
MRKVTHRKDLKGKAKSKWLVALLLCISCFVLCASMITSPTMAENDTTKTLDTLTNVTKTNWTGPAANVDKDNTSRPDSFKATATGGTGGAKAVAAYDLDKKYTKLTGTIVPAKDNPEGSKLKVKIFIVPVTDTATPAYQSSQDITKDSSGINFEITGAAFGEAQLLTIEVANASGEASVILADMQLTPAAAQPTTDHYVAVSGWTKAYEFVNPDGSSKTPKKFVYASDGKPENGYDYQLFAKETKFYAEYFKNSVYAALKADGTFDLNDAIWAG